MWREACGKEKDDLEGGIPNPELNGQEVGRKGIQGQFRGQSSEGSLEREEEIVR